MRFFITVLMMVAVVGIHAQDFNDYQPIMSSGQIPDEFLILSSEKYREKLSDIEDGTRKEKKDQKEFILQSSFSIDRMLLSGKVLYNDPISKYATKVLHEILKKNDIDPKGIRVYTIKSPYVNAFATDNGIIFINMGLLAQLENEAQLAYILAHEYIHVREKHSMNNYLEWKRIVREEGVYDFSESLEDKYIQKNNYSKELETEADGEGWELYKNTEYSPKVLQGVFDVLEYSYLPFDEVAYDKTFLETGYLTFPDEYFLNEVNNIIGEEYDEDRSTHPSVKTRRKVIADKISNVPVHNKQEFIISRDEFMEIRKMARYELVRLNILNHDYIRSIYTVYLLMKDNPDSKYLRKSLMYNLYALSEYSNAGQWNEVATYYKEVEGQIQQLYYLFYKLDRHEINVLALEYALRMEKLYPEDEEIKKITEKLFLSLADEHENDADFYFTQAPTDNIADTIFINDTLFYSGMGNIEIPEEVLSSLSKYEKIRVQRKLDEVNTGAAKEDDYIRFAFVDHFKKGRFEERYNEALNKVKNADDKWSKKEWRDYQTELKFKGASLGIDKVVLIDPFYVKINQAKDQPVNYIAGEEQQEKLLNAIHYSADKVGLEVELLRPKNFNTDDTESFNDLVVLHEWFNEALFHEELELSTINQTRLKELSEKYDTRYFCWAGMAAVKDRNKITAMEIVTGCILFPLLPYIIYQALRPQKYTYIFFYVFDVVKEEPVAFLVNEIETGDRNDVIEGHIFDILNQIKK